MDGLFFLSHPAHYHLFKNVINELRAQGKKLQIVIVTKDVLETLVKTEKWEYRNLLPEGRRSDLPPLINLIWVVIKTEWRMFFLLLRTKPKFLMGTELTLAHLGFLFRIPSLIVNEDDTSATPENWLFYPFATKIITPHCTDKGMWGQKHVIYKGYHELAYLHPKYFTPDREIVNRYFDSQKPYFIIRLASLTASHDLGKKGMEDPLVGKLIQLLEPKGKIWITSERMLEPSLEQYRIAINPQDIFHVLAFAKLVIGDSQTMTAEAAVLGTPAIRFNDFVGKLGYLLELEEEYGLSVGISAGQPKKLMEALKGLLSHSDLKGEWMTKRDKMLADTEDVNAFFLRQVDRSVGGK